MDELDRQDLVLLSELQRDSRQTVQQLAAAAGLSGTPAWKRIKEMEATGVIRLEQVEVVDGEGENRVPAELETSVYLGSHWEHVFRCGDQTLRAFGRPLSAGTHWLHLPPEQLWVF